MTIKFEELSQKEVSLTLDLMHIKIEAIAADKAEDFDRFYTVEGQRAIKFMEQEVARHGGPRQDYQQFIDQCYIIEGKSIPSIRK